MNADMIAVLNQILTTGPHQDAFPNVSTMRFKQRVWLDRSKSLTVEFDSQC